MNQNGRGAAPLATLEEPQVAAVGGNYKLTFPTDIGATITVKVSRVKDSSRGDTSAEFQIKAFGGLWPTFDHIARLNMLSSSTKNSIAKELGDTAQAFGLGKSGWRAMLEQTSLYVLKDHRQGTPVTDTGDYEMTDQPIEHRVAPLLEDRQASVIFGDGDTGKSFLAAYLGYLVVTGRESAGIKGALGNVLYLDYETDLRTTARRVELIANGFGEARPNHFMYRSMTQTLAADFERVRDAVAEHSIDLVIVDSAAMACGEPESAAETAAYFRALAGLECTSLTIAHVSKAGKEAEPFGSIFWRNVPRATYRVLSTQGPDGLRVGLRHTKSNNARRLPEMAFEFRFTDDTVTVSPGNPDDIDDMEAGAPLAKRISKLLITDGAKTVAELSAALGSTEGTIRSALNRMTGAVRGANHKWSLKA